MLTKLRSTISPYFEVKGIDKAVATVCQTCTGCAENKATAPRCGLLVGSIQSDNPLEKISTDLYGPFNGHEYNLFQKVHFLTITDIFSLYSKVMLLESATSADVCALLETSWLVPLGAPRILLSDNGRQYTASIFADLCDKYDIKHTFSNPYNPTGNAISERINQCIGNMLRIMKGSTIDSVIKTMERNLNCTDHRISSTLLSR